MAKLGQMPWHFAGRPPVSLFGRKRFQLRHEIEKIRRQGLVDDIVVDAIELDIEPAIRVCRFSPSTPGMGISVLRRPAVVHRTDSAICSRAVESGRGRAPNALHSATVENSTPSRRTRAARAPGQPPDQPQPIVATWSPASEPCSPYCHPDGTRRPASVFPTPEDISSFHRGTGGSLCLTRLKKWPRIFHTCVAMPGRSAGPKQTATGWFASAWRRCSRSPTV